MRQAKGQDSIKKGQKDSRVTELYRYRDFLSPVYWSTWLGIGALYLMAWLPVTIRIGLSRVLGRVLYHVVGSRRRIAETNIRLCFSHLSQAEQTALVKETFFSNTLAYFETAYAWCRPAKFITHSIEGLEHIEQAKAKGQGIMMLGGHFAPIDILGALVGEYVEYASVYRKHDNPLFNYFMTKSRERFSPKTIARKDIKGMIREFRSGGTIWYAPDQDYGRKPSIFVPFFGVQTATITMTSKLAQSGNAAVIPLSAHRTEDNKGIVIKFEPPLEIPCGDDVKDAITVNSWLEDRIKEHPAQCLWLHKRFKTRPEGEPSVY